METNLRNKQFDAGILKDLYRVSGSWFSSFLSLFGLADKPKYQTIITEIKNGEITNTRIEDGNTIDKDKIIDK